MGSTELWKGREFHGEWLRRWRRQRRCHSYVIYNQVSNYKCSYKNWKQLYTWWYIYIHIFMIINPLYVISMYVYCRYIYACCGMHMGQYSPISSGGESRHDIGSSHAGNASSASSATQIFYLSKSNNLCKDDRSQLRDITQCPQKKIASRPTGPIGPIFVKLKSLGRWLWSSQAHDSIVINVVGSSKHFQVCCDRCVACAKYGKQVKHVLST